MATQTLQASPRSYARSTGLLSGRANLLGARPVSSVQTMAELAGHVVRLTVSPSSSYAQSVAVLSGKVMTLSGKPKSTVSSNAALSGKWMGMAARPISFVTSSARMGGKANSLSARPFSSVKTSASVTGGGDSHGMSLCDVLEEVLAMWGILNKCSAPDFAIERAINDINAAMQTVWNHADERSYWSNNTLTLTLNVGESSKDLPNNIQNVVGPCRRQDNRQPLAPIGTIGELETFVDIYLDGETPSVPLAYHIERMAQTGADPARCVFHVTPAVAGSTASFLLEVVLEAPRYTVADLRTCPVVPIPHRYVESLLLPIARYQASSFFLFRKADQKETIDREYAQARVALGLADPLAGKAGDNKQIIHKEGNTGK